MKCISYTASLGYDDDDDDDKDADDEGGCRDGRGSTEPNITCNGLKLLLAADKECRRSGGCLRTGVAATIEREWPEVEMLGGNGGAGAGRRDSGAEDWRRRRGGRWSAAMVTGQSGRRGEPSPANGVDPRALLRSSVDLICGQLGDPRTTPRRTDAKRSQALVSGVLFVVSGRKLTVSVHAPATDDPEPWPEQEAEEEHGAGGRHVL